MGNSGMQDFALALVSSAVLDAIAEFAVAEKPKSLRRVRLVIYDERKMLYIFQQQLHRKVMEAASGHARHNWLSRTFSAGASISLLFLATRNP